MNRDCWSVLGIPATTDASIVKNAYRDLMKKYHPDTVQAPERVRKYTLKSVEIIHAYEEAMKFVEMRQQGLEANSDSRHVVRGTPTRTWQTVSVRVFAAIILLMFIITAIFLLVELLNVYPALTRSMNLIFVFYDSMPAANPFKMIISFPLALALGALIHGVLSIFTTAPVLYLWGVLSDTKYERYMYKLGFLTITALNISVVYLASGLHWPFEHGANNYYGFLYHLCRFLSWSYGPIYMLAEWVMDKWKYWRVKSSATSGVLVLHQPK